MAFLIRTGFWFSLVLLFLPLAPDGASDGGDAVGPLQAIVAARDAIGDVTGMCERKPEVCETGRAALQTIGVRARESARIAYELLDGQFGEPDATITTGGVAETPLPDHTEAPAARAQ